MADIAAKLQQLGDMKNGGLLSDEEFATAKAKILAEPVPQPAVAVTPLSIDVVGTWMLPGHVYIGMGQNAPIYMSGNILTIAPDLTIESTDVITQGSCLCCYLGATPAGYAMTDKPMPMTVTGPCEFEASIWATGTNSFAIVDKDTLKMKNRLMMQSYTGNALTFKRVGSPAGAVHSVNMERD